MKTKNTKVLTAVTYAKVGRSAVSGRYITVAQAKRNPRTTVVHKVRVPRRAAKHARKQ